MPRSQGVYLESNFIGGLKTEFTGLNFPENAATETFDCIFGRTGKVSRRLGIDIEAGGHFETLDRTDTAITSYMWYNASGDGTTNFMVVQTANKLWFYKVSDVSEVPSDTLINSSFITLTDFVAVDGPASIKQYECQYAQGQGYLFVFHPYLDPFYVSYDPVTDTVTGTRIDLRIRDFEGSTEIGRVDKRPTTLSAAHYYNLINQGWEINNLIYSATSFLMGAGSKTFTVSMVATDSVLAVGDTIFIVSRANPFANFMLGTVTAYAGSLMTVNVTVVSGAGTFADWTMFQAGSIPTPDVKISKFFDDIGVYPSNADVWWYYKDASDVYDPAGTIATVTPSTSPAPKGHFVVNPFIIDRSVYGVSNIYTTHGARPSTGEFFQNRIFYSGVKTFLEHAKIYFSQTIESPQDFGQCYQVNDPTSELFFDLLPTDGGVVTIQNAGVVVKLYATKSAVFVFTTRGVWAISGSNAEGLGFTANAFTVVKVSDIKIPSHDSFVEVRDTLLFWNLEGIWSLSVGGGAQDVQLTCLTDKTIATFYGNIPSQSKQFARGIYNPYTYIVQWIYKSTNSDNINNTYAFDRVLNLNIQTGAFYPWTISTSLEGTTINGINIVESFVGTAGYITKFITSKGNDFTFSEAHLDSYLDWVSEGDGIDYRSYFITGFGVHGQAQKYFQAGYVFVYAEDPDENGCAYIMQGLWDWANSGDTGRFTTKQRVDLPANNFGVIKRRLLLRGQGLSLQLKFESVPERPFHIIGWSRWESANATI